MSRRAVFAAALSILALSMSLSILGCRSTSRAPAPLPQPTPARDAPPEDVVVVQRSGTGGTFVALADVAGRRTAFVADEEEAAVVAIDLTTHDVVARAPLGAAPGQILLAPGGTLYAAVRGGAEIVALRLVEGGRFREIARRATGHEPYGLAFAEGAVLVTSIGDARLESFEASDLTPVAAVELPRDPRSVLVTASGTKAFVAHATGSVLSAVELGVHLATSPREARKIPLDLTERRRDFGQPRVMKPSLDFEMAPPPPVRFTMTRNATQGFGLAAIDDEVLVPEALVLTGDKNVVTGGYGSFEQSTLGSNVPFVARVSVADEKQVVDYFSGPADRACFEGLPECVLPRAVASDGRRAYVACLDSDEILGVDPKMDSTHADKCGETRKQRLRVKVERPSGVAVDRDRAEVVAFSVFTRKLTTAKVGDAGDAPPESFEVPRTGTTPSAAVALGRALFHESRDRRISGDGRACASCHVDGREDGMVWPTPKGMRQTPMLAGRLEGTGPFGWNGEHASLEIHIASTVENLGGKGLPKDDVRALAAFVASMKVPARRAAPGALALRGKEIFQSSDAECSSCHVEKTRFTDGEAHALSRGAGARFDTPSLHFVGLTPPYFHDGRFATLEELVDKCDGVMGSTKQLSASDRQALVAYLKTL